MRYLFLILSITAICIMIYSLFKVISLNRRIKGGIVGETWKLLYYMIGLFTVGYLTTLLFPVLPDSSRQLIVGIVFLAAAIFVVMVINLFLKIIKEIGLLQ